MKSSRTAAVLALALMLALSACASGDSGQVVEQEVYQFPAELLAAGEATTSVTTTTVPPLSEPDEPIKPPPPRAVTEAIAAADPLVPPSSELLPGPAELVPFVVSDTGERRLLRDVTVHVSYDLDNGLVVEPAGWWVVNYPLERIIGAEGRTADEVAVLLTGRTVDQLTNYYFYTAPASGETVPELGAAEGPASIRVTASVDLVVNNQHRDASDDNQGTQRNPLLTISEAVSRAGPGTVIHVYPGTYREQVIVTASGTSDDPIRIEGIRGASGAMPVITGNDEFPVGAWSEVDGLTGVYSADAFTGFAGDLQVAGTELIARSAPWDLERGEYVVTTGGDEYVDPSFNGTVSAREGTLQTFGSSQYIWELKPTDGGGFVDLGSEFGEDFGGGVYWGSAWVYVRRPNAASDYEWYKDFEFDLQVSGPFRSAGISGMALEDQPYDYRVWLDGELLESNAYATSDDPNVARPELGLGDYGETWHGVVMREGWHHLVFQWDTTLPDGETAVTPAFRFDIPELVGTAVTSASAPRSSRWLPDGEATNHVSEYMVLGPVPSSYDPTVYLRTPSGDDPNEVTVDLAARSGPVVSILGDHVELHGFDIRGGTQYEGQSLISIGHRDDDRASDIHPQGVVIEGNVVSGSQYGGIGVVVSGDMGFAPIEIRNNWVLDSGAIGISAVGSSDRLTSDTLNDWAPGRTPVVVEFNRVTNAGWAGYDRIEDVSGILFERMTASVIRYNEVVGGGPGITLRGENYAVRVDGNTVTGPYAWGIGVEANPGPNLIANNLVTGLRIGPDWYKAHLLTWDSDQTWIMNNTVDGLWSTETGWYADVGTWGAGGPENFQRFDYGSWDMTRFRRQYSNNVFLGNFLGGVEDYLGNWGETDLFTSNFREVPTPDPFDYLDDGAEEANLRYDFLDRDGGDYRLTENSELNEAGASNRMARLAVLDILGFPRFRDEGTAVGAYRSGVDVSAGASIIEVLFVDGTMVRIEG